MDKYQNKIFAERSQEEFIHSFLKNIITKPSTLKQESFE